MSTMFCVMRSTSYRTWVDMMTCPPSFANSEIVRRICTRAIGSAPERGSSRMRTSGSWARALVRRELSDQSVEERAFAGSVRPDQTRDARSERGGECVQPEDFAVPLGDAGRLRDRGHPATTSTAFIRRYVSDAATRVAAS